MQKKSFNAPSSSSKNSFIKQNQKKIMQSVNAAGSFSIFKITCLSKIILQLNNIERFVDSSAIMMMKIFHLLHNGE